MNGEQVVVTRSGHTTHGLMAKLNLCSSINVTGLVGTHGAILPTTGRRGGGTGAG